MRYIGKALLLFVLLLVADRGIGYGLKWMYFNQKGEDFYYTTKALDEQTADLVILGSSPLQSGNITGFFKYELLQCRTQWLFPCVSTGAVGPNIG